MKRARARGTVERGAKRAARSAISSGVICALFVALFAFGCQLITGDFKIEPATQAGPGTTQCKTGDFRCNGEYLLSCGTGDAGWVLKQTCGSTDLCDSKTKQCHVCKPGDGRCDGVVREQCSNDGGTWQQIQSCTSADMCNPTFCGNCMPGEYSCRGEDSAAGSELWQCGSDGTWSVHLDDCATPGLCSSTLDAARANPNFGGKCMMGLCDAGTYRCDGATLQHCRQDETAWDVVDTCATAALCAAAVASDAATLGSLDMCPVGCSTAGAYLCTGTALTKCRDDLTGFDPVTTCTDPNTECNPVVGACTALCTPGQYQCNDKSLRHCTSLRHWENVSDCASAALCTTAPDASSGQCLAPGCPRAGDYACSGATLSKCADDLSGYVAVTSCASADLCDATDKRCNDPVCTPANSYQCFDVSVAGSVQSQLRQCNAGETAWVDVGDPCPAGQFCSNDATDPGCKTSCPASTRCNGSELQTCTADTGWVHQATCATTNLCSCTLDGSCAGGKGSDGCGVAICGGSLPATQCSGAELQSCDAGRNSWDDQSDCGALGCVAASPSAYCAACHAGDASCTGSVLQVCPADQRALTTRQCGVANLCDATNKQCDVCTPPNSSTCSGNVLQHCSDDGQMLQSTTCPKLCDAAANRCDTCMPGTSRCSNNILYSCGDDGKTETPTTCDSNAHCDAANNRCVTCLPTEYHCNGAELQTCSSNQKGWTDKTACASATLCSASAGKCLTCLSTDFNCNGAELQTCNSSQTGWTDKTACNSAALCSASAGKCLTCLSTDFNCNGAELQTCNSSQTGWTDKTACASAPLCDKANGKCTPPTCAPTDFNCTDTGELQTCNATQTGWTDKTACVSAPLCDEVNGKCTPPTCAPTDFNCTDTGELQTCNSTQSGWTDKTACASAPLCDEVNGKCTPPTCAPTDFNCTSTGELQTCNSTQDGWTDKTACGSAALCDKTNGVCLSPTCQPTDYNCTMAGELQKCNAMQNGWSDFKDCVDPALCDKPSGSCLACTASVCKTNTLYVCDTMTGQFGAPMDCGTGTCDAASGTCIPSSP